MEGDQEPEEKPQEQEEEQKEEQEGDGEGEAVQVAVVKETYEIHNWQSKVARFLAYVVDGGILCSQFTLTSMVNML